MTRWSHKANRLTNRAPYKRLTSPGNKALYLTKPHFLLITNREIRMTKTQDTVATLCELRRRHVHAVRQRNRAKQALLFFVNRFLSPPGLPKGEFQTSLRKSEAVLKKYQKDGDPGQIPVTVLGDVEHYGLLIGKLEEIVKPLDKALEVEAENLQVAEWWTAQPGLGLGGLGKVVGDAGDIGTFRKAAGLWQRMGLRNVWVGADRRACSAVKKGELTAEEWVGIGYCPSRRSTMFQIVDSLLKKQLSVRPSAKELTAAEKAKLAPRRRWKPTGEYGTIAMERTAETRKTHPEWTARHEALDRNRVVSKRLLADLMKQWQRVTQLPDAQKSTRSRAAV